MPGQSGEYWTNVERSSQILEWEEAVVKGKKGSLRERLDSGEISLQEAAVMALNHPLRVKLMTRYADSPASPSQLEDAGLDTLSNLAYHSRVLHELRQIEIVDEIPRRGALEHIYRAVNPPHSAILGGRGSTLMSVRRSRPTVWM
jgi:hypothetical protein